MQNLPQILVFYSQCKYTLLSFPRRRKSQNSRNLMIRFRSFLYFLIFILLLIYSFSCWSHSRPRVTFIRAPILLASPRNTASFLPFSHGFTSPYFFADTLPSLTSLTHRGVNSCLVLFDNLISQSLKLTTLRIVLP